MAAGIGVLRMVVAFAGSWLAATWIGAGLHGIYAMLAAGLFTLGTIAAVSIRGDSWRRGR